ncbi:LemA family protein [Litchfieldella rifensis]|uniref:LemA family protein n=1 Tax=Litchfieldella rifensis TaxID=762643 RepID=A0ABV7LNX0_9GAMM
MDAGSGKRSIDGGVVRLLIIVLLGMGLISVPWLTHNRLVASEETVDAAWADVESNLQRRADLVPNLVRSLQEYMTHESETLVRLVRERAEALSEALERSREIETSRVAELNSALSQDLGRLMRHAGEHPELRSGDQFLRFQAQLEGSENRLNVARMRYNEAVREYQAGLRGFVGRWVAESMGLRSRDYFEASPAATEPFAVEF